MFNYIPKIVYNSITYTFPYPVEYGKGDAGETQDAVVKDTFSLSGELQRSVQYLEGNITVGFSFLKDADISALQTFFQTWAVFGKSFDYYEHASLPAFNTYQLKNDSLRPITHWRYPNGTKLYRLQLVMRRVIF